MRIGDGKHDFQWHDQWGRGPDDTSAPTGWAHHGVVVSRSGRIVAFHPGRPDVLVYEPDGTLVASWSTGLTEGHGLTLAEEDGREVLWIADPGSKMVVADQGRYEGRGAPGRVVKFTLAGELLAELPRPDIAAYASGTYAPTWVAVDEPSHGGSGDVWVVDGYGQSLLHCFDSAGRHLATIDGGEGAGGHFACPHALLLDRRRGRPELYIADRSNAQVQVYALDGTFLRVFGAGYLNSPSAFAVWGDRLVIGELYARLAVLDASDRLVGYLGEDASAPQRPGWPNAVDGSGLTVPPALDEGRFNSPHGVAVDGKGNLFVAEWLIGGRFTKLVAGGSAEPW